MDDIHQEDQDGGELQQTYIDSELEEVKQLFRTAGFSSQFLRNHTRRFKEAHDEHWHPRQFRNKYAESLLETLGFQGTISQTLQRIGVKPSVAIYAES